MFGTPALFEFEKLRILEGTGETLKRLRRVEKLALGLGNLGKRGLETDGRSYLKDDKRKRLGTRNTRYHGITDNEITTGRNIRLDDGPLTLNGKPAKGARFTTV